MFIFQYLLSDIFQNLKAFGSLITPIFPIDLVESVNPTPLVDPKELINLISSVDMIKLIKLIGFVDSLGLENWILVFEPKLFVRLALN